MTTTKRLVTGLCCAFFSLGAHAQIHQLAPGWNLIGNDTGQPINSATIFGTPTHPTTASALITSVWVWDAASARWRFFTPSLPDADLSSYALSKGYLVLTEVPAGAGFWVNASSALALNLANSTLTDGFPISYNNIRIESLTYATASYGGCRASLTFTNTTASTAKPYLYFDVVVANVAIKTTVFSYTMLPGITAMATNSIYDSSLKDLDCGTFSLRFNAPASFML